MDLRAILPASAAGVFALFLLWKMRPSAGRGGKALDPRVGELRAKARSASSAAARAKLLVEAGDLALDAGRVDASFGLFLRAARADRGALAPIEGLTRALGRRRRALDRVLWHHLASLDPVEHRKAIAATLDALAALHRRDPRRAEALAKLASMTRS